MICHKVNPYVDLCKSGQVGGRRRAATFCSPSLTLAVWSPDAGVRLVVCVCVILIHSGEWGPLQQPLQLPVNKTGPFWHEIRCLGKYKLLHTFRHTYTHTYVYVCIFTDLTVKLLTFDINPQIYDFSYFLPDRYEEENWWSPTPEKRMQGSTCAWEPTWWGNERARLRSWPF